MLRFLFSFHYVVISLVVYCIDEPMTAETRIQLIKKFYVCNRTCLLAELNTRHTIVMQLNILIQVGCSKVPYNNGAATVTVF